MSSQWAIVTVALIVSLLTLFSMTKIWAGVFWGEPESATPLAEGRTNGGPPLMVLATGLTVALSISFVVFAGPMFELAERAGDDLMNPSAYINAVLGGGGLMRARLRIPAIMSWLTALWIMLWGDLTWANLLGGIAIAGLVVLGRAPRFGVASTDLLPSALGPRLCSRLDLAARLVELPPCHRDPDPKRRGRIRRSSPFRFEAAPTRWSTWWPTRSP